MRAYFIFSIAYFGFALTFTPLFMQTGLTGLTAILIAVGDVWYYTKVFSIGLLIGLIVLFLTVDRKTLISRLPILFLSVPATFCMHAGFGLLKNVMPFVTPYFADSFMADLDNFLHFGVDPWVIAHQIGEYLLTENLSYFYTIIWGVPAIVLPLIIAIFDGDSARLTRTLIVYVVAWAFIGNVLAFAGLSAGPVYYDRLIGGDRFAGLTEILVSSGITSSNLGYLQQALWDIYTGQSPIIGSGISAFPSVHVATATVTSIYMCERSKWLFPIAALFLLTILFYSVYTGFHYAIDGYFSILVVFGVWWVLRRKYSPS